MQRRFDEAETLTLKAIELAPDYPLGYRSLGWIYAQEGANEKAIVALEKAVSLSGRDPAILSALGSVYASANRTDDALRILEELDEAANRVHVSKCDAAQIHIKLGDFDRASDLLQEAFEERDISLVLLAVDPDLDDLRGDARFECLKKLVGLGV